MLNWHFLLIHYEVIIRTTPLKLYQYKFEPSKKGILYKKYIWYRILSRKKISVTNAMRMFVWYTLWLIYTFFNVEIWRHSVINNIMVSLQNVGTYTVWSCMIRCWPKITLQWRHYGHDSVSNHQPHDCLLKHLFRRRSKKTSKLRVTGIFAGNSSVPGEFPAQMASNAENVSIWWRHHAATATSALKSITRPHELYGVHCTNYIISISATPRIPLHV